MTMSYGSLVQMSSAQARRVSLACGPGIGLGVNSFLVPGPGPYLLTHSVGCLPQVARDALDSSFLRPWAERGGNAWPDWLQQVDGFRSALADLFGGAPAEYCPQSNLSSGLAKLLLALPPAPADKRTLLAAEDSFPSLGFVLRQAERQGFTLRLMPRSQSPDDIRSWSEALTPDVRVALVTHVHSNTGRVAPVAEVARLCAERDILCVADVAQSAGILPMKFPALGADIVLGSCIKWLCGGPGAGFPVDSPVAHREAGAGRRRLVFTRRSLRDGHPLVRIRDRRAAFLGRHALDRAVRRRRRQPAAHSRTGRREDSRAQSAPDSGIPRRALRRHGARACRPGPSAARSAFRWDRSSKQSPVLSTRWARSTTAAAT